MGQEFSTAWISPYQVRPDHYAPTTYPEQYGFEEKGVRRKEREMIATPEEMASMKLEPKFRNFCAHKWIDFQTCTRNVYPWVIKCSHEKHLWEECMNDDLTISRKEYEREQRLLLRNDRKERIARLKEERRRQLEEAESRAAH